MNNESREVKAARVALEMQPQLRDAVQVDTDMQLVRFDHSAAHYIGTGLGALYDMLNSLCAGTRVDLSKAAYCDSHNRKVAVAMLAAYLAD